MTRLALAVLLTAFSSLASAQDANVPDLTALAGGGEQPQFLHPDQAFQVTARMDGDALELRFAVHEGYYLYRDKLNVTLEAGSPRLLGELDLPAGEGHEDEYFGKQRVYRGEAIVRAKLGGSGPFTVKVQYQGCADAGLCYPPQFRSFGFDAGGVLVAGGTPGLPPSSPVNTILLRSPPPTHPNRTASPASSARVAWGS